jgi:hypothetical protein
MSSKKLLALFAAAKILVLSGLEAEREADTKKQFLSEL